MSGGKKRRGTSGATWITYALLAAVLALSAAALIFQWRPERRVEGSSLIRFRMGPVRGFMEAIPDDLSQDGKWHFQFIDRDGYRSPIWSRTQLETMIGNRNLAELTEDPANPVYKLLNITSPWSLLWICIGLGGQVLFFLRMAVQWLVSERRGESVVPPVFWYMSFLGGVCLFLYFVWRQDPIGVIGQSTGVVIYGRNIVLLRHRKG